MRLNRYLQQLALLQLDVEPVTQQDVSHWDSRGKQSKRRSRYR